MFVTTIISLTHKIAAMMGLDLQTKLAANSLAQDRQPLITDRSTFEEIYPIPPYDDPLY
jgi:hypothetical protein